MKPIDAPTLSVNQLIDACRHAASAHGEATVGGDHNTANHHHDIVAAIYRELQRRGTSAQLALVPLYGSSDSTMTRLRMPALASTGGARDSQASVRSADWKIGVVGTSPPHGTGNALLTSRVRG